MLEIQRFDKDQKMVALEIGKSRTIESYFNLIHIINLNNYEKQIVDINDTIDKFEKQNRLKDITNTCRLKLKGLEIKLHTLNPYKRTKRGLINALGSAIKFITGNMDANDADIINKQIRELEDLSYDSADMVNNQKSLNLQMMQRFKNLTDHINNQQDTLTEYLKKFSIETSNNIRKEENVLEEMQYLNKLDYNINLLTEHITDIIEAVMLAKLGVISRLILQPDELDEIRNNLMSQEINLISDENIYELLELQAFYKESNLIFNIKIPNLSNIKNTFYHLIPLPINDTMQILTKPYVSFNEHIIQYYTAKCPKIESVYYCKTSPEQEESQNSPCIAKLLTGESPNCPLNDVGNTTTIFQPEENHIIFINVKRLLIYSNCSNKNLTIKGSSMLRFKNCTVTVGDTTYKDNPSVHWDEILLAPPNYNNIEISAIHETLNLNKLMGYNFINNNEISKLKYISTLRHNIVLSTSILFMLIFTTSLFVLWKRSRITYYPETLEVALAPPKSLWPSLYNKGGGVTLSHCAPPKPPRLGNNK